MTQRDYLQGRRITIDIDGALYEAVIQQVLSVNPAGQQLSVWVEDRRELISITIPENDGRLKP